MQSCTGLKLKENIKMEVYGRKEFSDKIDITILCQPCQGDDDTVSAEGYCETCNEFLCSVCIKAHRKLALTKNHEIKSKDEMPTSQISKDPCTELCAVHHSETVKFYCQQHDSVGCGDCMVLEHKSCKLQLVSDVSRSYGNSNELIRIKNSIGHLKRNIAACKHEIERSLKEAEETKAKVVEEINTFRKDLNNYLDQVQAEIITKIEQINAKDVCQQRKLQDQCKAFESEMAEFQKKLEQNSEKVNHLFVTSKLLQKRLQICQEINQDISAKSQINIFQFEPSNELTALQMKYSPLGNLSTEVKKFAGPSKRGVIEMKTNFVERIKVQAVKEDQCWITGMAMIARDEILLADHNNTSLKVLNVSQGRITSTFKLPSEPWDVTVINSETAATTLPGQKKILFFNTESGLSESHSLNVRDGCAGIDYHNGIMAVSFCKPPAVQVLDMEGNILHEVTDKSIFKVPFYIHLCLSSGNKSMFVSDRHNRAIYELTVDGHLKATIKSEDFMHPAGLAVTSDGTVFVCYVGNSDSLSMIVPGTRDILPLYIQNVEKPWSILVCEEQNKLYICEHESSNDSSCMKVFDLE